MAAPNRARGQRDAATGADYGRFSAAVDLLRRGETVLTLIDPASRARDPETYVSWLRAQLTIGELPRLLQRPCDERCAGVEHHPDAFFVLSDLALDPAAPRRSSWWGGWNDALEREHQAGPMWFAGAPTLPLTPNARRIRTGTRLRRIVTTDPYWVAYDGGPQEMLFRIEEGRHAGASLVAVTFGHAPLLPSLAGALIAPDHPPNRDPQVAIRTLAAGWAAVERGLPFEE